jgi:hypothetical protein
MHPGRALKTQSWPERDCLPAVFAALVAQPSMAPVRRPFPELDGVRLDRVGNPLLGNEVGVIGEGAP